MNRRNFIRITSLYSGGALLFSSIPVKGFSKANDLFCFQPHPLIKLCDDGSIIIYVRKQEMGQGVDTSLPMIVAEEMEADWQYCLSIFHCCAAAVISISRADAPALRNGCQLILTDSLEMVEYSSFFS